MIDEYKISSIEGSISSGHTPTQQITVQSLLSSNIVRRMPWSPEQTAHPEPLLNREWLVTNALGGYASGTIAGVPTRRYHGLLIAALPAPLGRTVMLGQVTELIRLQSGKVI